MGLINATILVTLRALANLEFQAGQSAVNGFFRRAFVRYMRVKHGRDFAIGLDVYFRARGNIIFGERCALGSFAKIWNYAPIKVGDDFLSAGCLTINSATHDPVTLESIGRPITIGNRVWCGQNVTILAGVNIGDDVVIGAGSLVIKDIPSSSIVAGVPAKVIRPLLRKNHPKHPLFQKDV